MSRPRVNADGQRELDRAEDTIASVQEEIKSFNPFESLNKPVQTAEPQLKLSDRELNRMDAPYLKPVRSINSKEPFNEKFRRSWEEAWKYVKCVVENYEIIGEDVEVWTKRFPGDPAHFWKVPVNKPVFMPRLLAEQLSQCKYHRLKMENNTVTNSDGMGTYHGALSVDCVKERISAKPVGFGFVSMAG